jgi:hypothetical protein
VPSPLTRRTWLKKMLCPVSSIFVSVGMSAWPISGPPRNWCGYFVPANLAHIVRWRLGPGALVGPAAYRLVRACFFHERHERHDRTSSLPSRHDRVQTVGHGWPEQLHRARPAAYFTAPTTSIGAASGALSRRGY